MDSFGNGNRELHNTNRNEARHVRHYILRNSSHRIRTDTSSTTYLQAGKEHLISLIRAASFSRDVPARDIVFSLPYAAPAHYSDWLASVADKSGFTACSTVSEITAAATGYGISGEGKGLLLLFDFGADSLEISVGIPTRDTRCAHSSWRVVGHAADDTGGRFIDWWLAEQFLTNNRIQAQRAILQHDNGRVLETFRQAKELLSSRDETSASIPVRNAYGYTEKTVTITRHDLERVLKGHGLFEIINRTIDRALSAARIRGYDVETIDFVLMIGGGSLIPSIQKLIRQRFRTSDVRYDHSRDAIALGAARYSSHDQEPSQVSRDYALRYWDPGTGQHQYRYIIRRGTAYPTKHDLSRLLVTAAYDGQTHLGLALYSVGEDTACADNRNSIELVSDPQGTLRQCEPSLHNKEIAAEWINEQNPTLLAATPPAKKGDIRFELAFRIDTTGHLLVSARDVMSGQYVLENYSMAKLT